MTLAMTRVLALAVALAVAALVGASDGPAVRVTTLDSLIYDPQQYPPPPEDPYPPPPSYPPPPDNPTPPPSAVVTPKSRLLLTAGPAKVITLKTSAGKTVKTMKRGTYTVTVRDRGRIHNAHVVAPGYNRKTSPLTYTGTQTWKVKLAKVGTLRFYCDQHRITGMRGSAKIVR